MQSTIDPNKEINVLITDGEVKFSFQVIKCLSNYKFIKIHLLSKHKWIEMRFSRNIKSFNHYSKINSEKEWVALVKDKIVEKNINVIFPVNVRDIKLLSKYKDEFEKLVPNLILPSTQSFDIANDKWNLFEFLKKHKISCPKTINLNSIDKNNISNIQLPVIKKPLSKMGGTGIEIVENKKSLKSIIKRKKPCIIQNFIKGFDIDMSVLCENGDILAYTIQQGYIFSKTPFSMPHGVKFLEEGGIYETIKKLIKKLEWSGFAHIDLRYDEDEKNYKVIEMNPRIWGSIELSKSVGVNFPYLYCLASLGVEFDVPKYRFEKCVTNIGLVKVLKSKIYKKSIKYPDNTIIMSDILDPIPALYKFSIKKLKNIFPKRKKMLKKFKHDIYA